MSYLVDTNVVSEYAKKVPDQKVLSWIESAQDELYLSVVTIEELRFGELMLPKGKRRDMLSEIIDSLLAAYGERIWPFDAEAAQQCAILHRYAVASGRTATLEDLMIAAIAKQHGATVATRNVRDFDYLDVPCFNPFG